MGRIETTGEHAFLLLAIDGLQARLDAFGEQLQALREVAEAQAAPAPKRSHLGKVASRGRRPEWTDEQRAAKSRQMKKAWRAGIYASKFDKLKKAAAA